MDYSDVTLPAKMRAVILHGFGDLRVQDVRTPTPRSGEVTIAVRRVQLSVTEGMLLMGDPVPLHDDLAQRLAIGPVPFGGHEFVGIVVDTGVGVDDAVLGARVTAVETLACAACAGCRVGAACARPEFLGFTRPGALAEYVTVPIANVVSVPDAVSDAHACAIQPLVGALHAHDLAAVRSGETVLVVGAGVMGLHAIQLARHGNAGTIIASSRSVEKRALAARVGADHVVDAADDVAHEVHHLTDGRGADVVVETAGGAPSAGLGGSDTLNLAIRAAARSGRVVVVSVLADHALVSMGRLRTHGISLLHPGRGADARLSGPNWFGHALALAARGLVDVGVSISHEVDGLERVRDAVAITMDKPRHGALGPAQMVVASTEEDRPS